jgi:hypothetical protein
MKHNSSTPLNRSSSQIIVAKERKQVLTQREPQNKLWIQIRGTSAPLSGLEQVLEAPYPSKTTLI